MSTLHVENLKGLSSGGNANKIIVPSGQTLDASNGFTPPSGHVKQVKIGGSTAWTTTTSTTAVDALTCSITPSATTSNVLVSLNLNGITVSQNSRCGILELYRDTTLIRNISGILGYSVSHLHYNTDMSCNYLDDAVSTTSQVTYTLKYKINNASGYVGFNNFAVTNNTTSSAIMLMEIAG